MSGRQQVTRLRCGRCSRVLGTLKWSSVKSPRNRFWKFTGQVPFDFGASGRTDMWPVSFRCRCGARPSVGEVDEAARRARVLGRDLYTDLPDYGLPSATLNVQQNPSAEQA